MKKATKNRGPMPAEVWLLWNKNAGMWALPIDDPNGGENYLCAFSRADAIAAARHQEETYGTRCVPVRFGQTGKPLYVAFVGRKRSTHTNEKAARKVAGKRGRVVKYVAEGGAA